MAQQIGEPLDRVDGLAKVTGHAQYAAEYHLPDRLVGILVTSIIAKGRIRSIDSSAAERLTGVRLVLSHLNRPMVPGWTAGPTTDSRVEGREFRVFEDDRVYHDNQPVVLVVADTLGAATEGARVVSIQYEKQPHRTLLKKGASSIFPTDAILPKREKAYIRGTKPAVMTFEAQYETPLQVHNPMEMHAATVIWDSEDRVRIFNKTQAVKLARGEIMKAFQLKEENVIVHSPYVGGAFGSSSRVWPPEMAAVLAAKKLGKPVTVMAQRDQVFNMVGYRPASIQTVRIAALKDGTLQGIEHNAIGGTSTYEEFPERINHPTRAMYACPYIGTDYRLSQLDMSTPCWTRAPGEASGSFALESAMDELAHQLKIDPLDLRLKNFAERDPEKNLPWSSNHLRECYERGAKQFGWERRNAKPGAMRSGDWLIGYGMNGGIYKSERSPASASMTLKRDGTLIVKSSVADVGPGSATIFSQIAADATGIEISKVKMEWGNSTLPTAPGQFGSHTTASVGTAVHEAGLALMAKLRELAGRDAGAGGSADANSATELIKTINQPEVTVTVDSKPGPESGKFSGKSFCANFVEVRVHAMTGEVRVRRIVSAIDAGRVMNIKTATSQVYGSITWALGIALMEEGVMDHRYGRYVNNDLANYHLPVQMDMPEIEVIFIDKPDPVIDPMGAKGLGEIGMVGLSAAIANAVFNATGKRIRQLPITPDKLL